MKKVLGLLLVGLLVSGCAYAWPGGWGHDRYEYRGGHYWLGGAIVGGLVAGAIIASLPPRVTYVNGYYTDGTYWYQQGPEGYIVVAPPQPTVVVVQNPQLPNHSIPREFIPVTVGGIQYYSAGNKWYVDDRDRGLIEVRNPIR